MSNLPAEKPSAEILVSVQFLRGLAASFVVAVHLLQRYANRGIELNDLPEWVWALGQVGVCMFFAISGFIMVHTTARDFGVPGKGTSFILRRYIRVAPFYYFTTILIMIFQYCTQSMASTGHFELPDFRQIVMSATFIPYMGEDGLIQPIYGLGWTLEYEIFFYLVFAGGILLPRRIGMSVIVGSLLGLMFLGSFLSEPSGSHPVMVVLYFFTRPILFYFLIGVAIALLSRVRGPLAIGLSEQLICFAAFGSLAAAVLLGGYWIHVGIAVALALATLLRPAAAPTSSLFSTLARASGDASYSMYLTHSFFLGAIALATFPIASTGTAGLAACILAACLFCFCMAWCSRRFVEGPMARSAHRLMRTRAKSAPIDP